MTTPDRLKLVASSVRGKIRCYGAGGTEHIGQWGGTECFLSVEPVHGPVLVVVGSRHKRGEGTLFRLALVSRIFDREIDTGKASFEVKHGARECILMIETAHDAADLQSLVAVAKAPSRWGEIEHGVLGNLKKTRGKREKEDDGGVTRRDHLLRGQPVAGTDMQYYPADKADDDHTAEDPVQFPPEARPRVVRLSVAQLAALEDVRQGKNVVVSGVVGSGKTEWLRHALRGLSPATTVITATTGPAARNLGGVAIQWLFGFGSAVAPSLQFAEALRQLKRKTDLSHALCMMETLVVDEADRISANAFDLFDHVARHFRNRHAEPFGGIRLVCAGDFCEQGPTRKHQLPTYSSVWRELQPVLHEFEQPFFHVVRDDRYANFLRKLRKGNLDSDSAALLESRTGITSTLDAIEICTTDVAAQEINVMRCTRDSAAAGETQRFTFRAHDDTTREDITLDVESVFPDSLELYVGVRVVLLADDANTGRRAGECGTVSAFTTEHATPEIPAHPLVLFDGAAQACMVVEHEERVWWHGAPIALRRQIPLRVGYALPLEVARHLWFDAAVLRGKPSWDPRDFYIAASRVCSAKGLSIANNP